ncbi:hypothetical protein V12B01_13170 [Vibrio splendidus 12B01]|nr:hypothetical protein V12B01_13170 [Vibrio splendidus 12B01]
MLQLIQVLRPTLNLPMNRSLIINQ